MLQQNPRGTLIARDELSGWFRSFTNYTKGSVADTSNWLELHQAGPVTVNRKTGECRDVFVKAGCASICGTIQPGILRQCLTSEHRESGLAARLLLCQPPERRKRWTEDEVHPDTENKYSNLIQCLASLAFADNDCNPVVIALGKEAKDL